MILKYLIEKEFKQMARDPFILFIVIALPVLVMLVFPWATTMEIKNVNVAVVDNDRSDLSRLLTEKIASTEYFDITGVFMRSDDAMEQVEFGDADIILEVPYGFEQDLLSEGSSSLLIEANAVNGTKASLGTSYLDVIVLDFTEEVNLERGAVTLTASGGIAVDSYYWFNPTMDYKIPMIPALIMLVVALITGFLPAMNIVGEKEAGTIEQINVTPVPKITFIVGKLIPYWVIGVIVLSVGMLVAWLLYGLRPEGSVLLLYGLSLLFIFVRPGPDHLQLLQHDAAGDVHDILHHHRLHPDVRYLHPHQQHAGVGEDHIPLRSLHLFRRDHADDLFEGQYLPGHPPIRLPAPGLLRGHHRLGRPQLQKARLIPDLL